MKNKSSDLTPRHPVIFSDDDLGSMKPFSGGEPGSLANIKSCFLGYDIRKHQESTTGTQHE